jgi:hypothetical protein
MIGPWFPIPQQPSGENVPERDLVVVVTPAAPADDGVGLPVEQPADGRTGSNRSSQGSSERLRRR